MPDCELTFSTFSASANSPTGVRKGWRAKVADQLIDGKRYIGRTASAAATEPSLNTKKGHHSTIVHDCANDCEVYGSTYSRGGDGKLKARASIADDSQPLCLNASRLRLTITILSSIPDCNLQPSGTYILLASGCTRAGSDCCFRWLPPEPPLWGIFVEFALSSGNPTCLWARFGIFPTCLGTYTSDFGGHPECAARPGTPHAPWLGPNHSYSLKTTGGDVLARITAFEFLP